jgi:hypothetical protein
MTAVAIDPTAAIHSAQFPISISHTLFATHPRVDKSACVSGRSHQISGLRQNTIARGRGKVVMSQNFEPPGSAPPQAERRKVEVFADFKDDGQRPYNGEDAAELLLKYERLVAAGGLEGWALIHALLGDDWAAPPVRVRILVNGREVARIPYDRPKRRRR